MTFLNNNFSQQVVFISAAASGIGRAVAFDLARCGATVHITDIDGKAIDNVKMEADNSNLDIKTHVLDMMNDIDLKNTVEKAINESGKIDILINNAGGSLRTPFHFLDQSDQDWQSVFDLNIKLTVQLTRLILPSMISNKYGRIINIGSKAGRYGSLFAGASYVAAKGAVHALTLQLAQEFGPMGITCNAICPGAIMTSRVQSFIAERQSIQDRTRVINEIPVRRHGEIEDITNAISFLASKDSSFITGMLLDVNGGQAMCT
jgi:NAD(P)-dependent dehydrogenase (short-subunit alcohol dehydrogenase family)